METLVKPPPKKPSLTPISMTVDTNPVTHPCTVIVAATLPDGSEPELELDFFEVQGLPDESTPTTNIIRRPRVAVAQPPAIIWNQGVATFSLVMDSSIFEQLSSSKTHFSIVAKNRDVPSWGMALFVINLG